MKKSGIERQLSQIPQQLMQSIQQKASQSIAQKGPNLVFAALAESVKHAYQLDNIKQEINATLHDNLTNADVIEILGWFASDAGKLITEHEVQISESTATPNGLADMQAFMERLKMVEPEEHRLMMIKNLNNAIHAADFMVDTTLNTTSAFMKAMQKTLPKDAQKQMGDANMDKQFEEQRKSLLPVFTTVAENSLLYTYKDITDENLSAYIKFCQSPVGKKFYQMSFFSLKKALNKANTEMANYFASKIQLDTPPPAVPYSVPSGFARPPMTN
jgi:hypothetical protein